MLHNDVGRYWLPFNDYVTIISSGLRNQNLFCTAVFCLTKRDYNACIYHYKTSLRSAARSA